MLELSTPVQYVKGVGPRIGEVLAGKGIHTVGDLLHYLPFRYEDRLNPRGISELRPGEMATVIGEVRNSGLFRTRSMPIFQLTVGQGRARLRCLWFQRHLPARQVQARPNDRPLRQSRRRPTQPRTANHSAADSKSWAMPAKTAKTATRKKPPSRWKSAASFLSTRPSGRLTPRWFRTRHSHRPRQSDARLADANSRRRARRISAWSLRARRCGMCTGPNPAKASRTCSLRARPPTSG